MLVADPPIEVTKLPVGKALHRVAYSSPARSRAIRNSAEFALLYGSPVPGYRAPADTIAPANRIHLLLFGIARDCAAAGLLTPPRIGLALPDPIRRDVAALVGTFDVAEVPEEAAFRAVAAWTHLVGHVSLELFGHLDGAFRDNFASFTACG